MTTRPIALPSPLPFLPYRMDTIPGIDPGPLPSPVPGFDPDFDPEVDPDPVLPPGPESPGIDPGFPGGPLSDPLPVT